MNMTMTRAALLAAAISPVAIGSPAHACASCGCTLTADWLSQGLAAQPGTTFSLRYDYIPQTKLQSGTHERSIEARSSLPTDREIERYTYNHSLTVTLDHQFANDLGLDVQLPLLTRPHSTIAEDTIEPSHSDTHGHRRPARRRPLAGAVDAGERHRDRGRAGASDRTVPPDVRVGPGARRGGRPRPAAGDRYRPGGARRLSSRSADLRSSAISCR